MARYKYIDTNPRFLPIDLAAQLLPGTLEHALHHLLGHAIDLSHFDARYRNDETGAPAYPDERRGAKGAIRKSNRTDNESAKMATGKGVIQGYCGVTAVDSAHQIIVEAQAHGTGSEQELLLPIVTALREVRAPHTLFTADAGYHSEANLHALAVQKIEALIADNQMRQRDARVATQERHQQGPPTLHNKSRTPSRASTFQPRDFLYDAAARTCTCPAGKSLYRKGQSLVTNGFVSEQFRGAKRDCVPCPLRTQCLRTPGSTTARQVAFFRGRATQKRVTHSARMKQRIDSPEGRTRYGQRFATVEPVFANLRYNKRLDRFTLRGRAKEDGQWKLFCLVHNIEKLAKHGFAA